MVPLLNEIFLHSEELFKGYNFENEHLLLPGQNPEHGDFKDVRNQYFLELKYFKCLKSYEVKRALEQVRKYVRVGQARCVFVVVWDTKDHPSDTYFNRQQWEALMREEGHAIYSRVHPLIIVKPPHIKT